jgi:selenocysteine-specific elongation factor
MWITVSRRTGWGLTGMEPDRRAEERRRGMTIDLGFAWTTLRSGERTAFVDVPGKERFVTTRWPGWGRARR